MRNQLLFFFFVVADLILQFVKLRQSACVTVQAATDRNEDRFFFVVKYLQWCHKHSDHYYVSCMSHDPCPQRIQRCVVKHHWKRLRKENAKSGPGASEVKLEKALLQKERERLESLRNTRVELQDRKGCWRLEPLSAEITFLATVWSAQAFFSTTENLSIPKLFLTTHMSLKDCIQRDSTF